MAEGEHLVFVPEPTQILETREYRHKVYMIFLDQTANPNSALEAIPTVPTFSSSLLRLIWQARS